MAAEPTSESAAPRHRTIRSFVVRTGRMTAGQQKAMDEYWPRYGLGFDTQPLALDALFHRQAPRVLEIGFGNGEHLASLAQARPEADFIGIEVHPPGVGHLLHLIEHKQLGNVRVSCHDAVEVLREQIPPAGLAEVLILFPDPWHKARHHKRRLIQPAFVELLATRIRPGGVLRLATDWVPYAEQMLAFIGACSEFINLAADGGYLPRDAQRAPTRFERRGERLGHEVRDLAFVRAPYNQR